MRGADDVSRLPMTCSSRPAGRIWRGAPPFRGASALPLQSLVTGECGSKSGRRCLPVSPRPQEAAQTSTTTSVGRRCAPPHPPNAYSDHILTPFSLLLAGQGPLETTGDKRTGFPPATALAALPASIQDISVLSVPICVRFCVAVCAHAACGMYMCVVCGHQRSSIELTACPHTARVRPRHVSRHTVHTGGA